jgi:hypothetical protein
VARARSYAAAAMRALTLWGHFAGRADGAWSELSLESAQRLLESVVSCGFRRRAGLGAVGRCRSLRLSRRTRDHPAGLRGRTATVPEPLDACLHVAHCAVRPRADDLPVGLVSGGRWRGFASSAGGPASSCCDAALPTRLLQCACVRACVLAVSVVYVCGAGDERGACRNLATLHHSHIHKPYDHSDPLSPLELHTLLSHERLYTCVLETTRTAARIRAEERSLRTIIPAASFAARRDRHRSQLPDGDPRQPPGHT